MNVRMPLRCLDEGVVPRGRNGPHRNVKRVVTGMEMHQALVGESDRELPVKFVEHGSEHLPVRLVPVPLVRVYDGVSFRAVQLLRAGNAVALDVAVHDTDLIFGRSVRARHPRRCHARLTHDLGKDDPSRIWQGDAFDTGHRLCQRRRYRHARQSKENDRQYENAGYESCHAMIRFDDE